MYFEEPKSFRPTQEEWLCAKKHCYKRPDKYENMSHYVRVALIKLNQQHEEEEKNVMERNKR